MKWRAQIVSMIGWAIVVPVVQHLLGNWGGIGAIGVMFIWVGHQGLVGRVPEREHP